jgi:serine/threonine protein phosphatase PrpC
MGVYTSFAVTKTGISHIKHGKGCQDASSGQNPNGVSIAVVSDGHGDDNCFRSSMGANLAAACGARGAGDFVQYLDDTETPEKENILEKGISLIKGKPQPPSRWAELSKEEAEKILRERLIKQGINSAWFKLVEDDFTRNPFSEEELKNIGEKYRNRYQKGESLHHAYGATLIAAAITEHYWFAIHIGDGRLVALYPDGSFDQPVPWDEKCFLNVTTSICDDDAVERSRCYFSFHRDKTPPAAVFLCTDGIDDNYPVDGNEEHLFKLYRTIAMTFAEDGFDSTCIQLEDLANSFATRGKGDDTSIAGFVDMEAVRQAVPVWEKQIAGEEAEKDGIANYGSFITAENRSNEP